MSKQTVGSREYKIMLKTQAFNGDENVLCQAASDFWDRFTAAIDHIVLDTDGQLNKIKKRRTVRFYDTPDRRLRGNDYVFRERIETDTDEKTVTLKFRHPDRYIAQDRNMDSAGPGKSKFEEDLKPALQDTLPFISLYSFSTKQRIDSSIELGTIGDVAALFPGLRDRLDDYNPDEAITTVCGFTARELVLSGPDFEIRTSPKLEAECALIVWYNNSNDHDRPELVEFSFKYEDEHEDYSRETAQRALDVFRKLQSMEAVDRQSLTKTAYVYQLCNPGA